MTRSVLQRAVDWGRRNSPWIIRFHSGSCSGCDAELQAALSSRYDLERWGVTEQGSPRQADVLICTGAVTLQEKGRLRQIYEQMLEPKFVLAVGSCACSGGAVADCYAVAGGVDSTIPVDVYLPGCAARPEAIIDAIRELLANWEKAQKFADTVEE